MKNPVCVQWALREGHVITSTGWCAVKSQPKGKLTEQVRDRIGGRVSVGTLCDHVVMFPFGVARRAPTCLECQAKLKKKKKR